MKHFLVAALTAGLLQAAWPAAAQQPPGQPPFGRPDRQDRQDRGDRERPPARDAAWPGRDGHDGQGGRMSPQEREQLRRDINSHGRDIYRQDRGRR